MRAATDRDLILADIKRGAILDEAAALVADSHDGINTVRLAAHLARKHRVRVTAVSELLQLSPRLAEVGSRFVLRRPSRVPSTPASADAEAEKWGIDLQLSLSEIETDAVVIDVLSESNQDVLVPMRVDFVRRGRRTELWCSALMRAPKVATVLRTPDALALQDSWRLPLQPAAETAGFPTIFVWPRASEREAVAIVKDLLFFRLRVNAQRLRITTSSCSPRELDRRLRDRGDLQRLRSRRSTTNRGRRDFVQRHCDRCGQPLSDPQSVLMGIGPECRRYYSAAVLEALRNPTTAAVRPGSLTAESWLTTVSEAWSRWR